MKNISILFALVLLLAGDVGAFEASSLVGYTKAIYDETNTLSSDEVTTIESKITSIREKYTAEVLVVLLSTTDGQDISQLGVEIGQKVGVGKADVDNGLVILIALEDRAWNISTGYGLEGVLPDIIVNRIAQENFPSNFREEHYAEGILDALADIEGYIAKDPSVISKLETQDELETSVTFLIWYFFIALFISAFIFQKDLKSGNMQSFGKKLLITYLITLPIGYLLIGFYALIINFFIWLFASLFSGVQGTGRGGSGTGWGGGGGGSSGGGFGGGGFGGGGSSGKW